MKRSNIKQLAWRNLWRHKTRSWLTVSAIAITTLLLVFMLSFQFGTYETMKEQNLSLLSGFAQVQNPDFKEQPNLEHGFKIPEKWSQILDQQKMLAAYGYRAQTFAILSNLPDSRNRAVQIIGVQVDKEKLLSSLSQKVTRGDYFADQSVKMPIVLGKQLADYLELKIGDQLQLLGQDAYGSLAVELFTLVGTFDLNIPELNQQLAQIRLNDFQTLFAYPNQAQQLVMKSDKLPQMDLFAKSLFAQLQQTNYPQILLWRDWKDLQPALYQAIQMDIASAFLWYSALLLIVILIVVNTLYMSLLERHNEFALLHALGMQPNQISRMLALETLFLILLGLLLGWLGGVAISAYFIQVGINLPGMEEMYAQFGISGTLYPELSALSMGFVPAVFLMAWMAMSVVIRFKLSGIRPLTGRQL
ncbi:ABC transporter permease [Thiomicrorhabdus xiamenensis]|uniref:ABC transporter permease n=1 Tax=Thiomicrorhabdus xiamenensis TaxID=2739063 RepID=A0A7D4SM33_9GAMM|nr:FtsX-like permease family protein [Thiomicrorhabdus xiamenensis]QKI88101.1 ABC transporter permease [Thiomicrorhabdus xiamenensis]